MKRTIQFTSVYGEEEVTNDLVIEFPEHMDEEAQRDFLWGFTGTGRTHGDAGYFAESIDGLEPAISEEWV